MKMINRCKKVGKGLTDEMRGWQQKSECANSAKMIKFYVQYKYCRNKMAPKPTLTTHSSQMKEKKIMFKLKSNESTDISIFMETVTARHFKQTHTENTFEQINSRGNCFHFYSSAIYLDERMAHKIVKPFECVLLKHCK